VKTEESSNSANVSSSTRRAFVFRGAAACGAIAFWSLRPASAVSAMMSERHENNGPVTIIQFSVEGKKIGKVTVPKVVKTDDQWRSQLSGISYQVARQSGTERAYSGSTWDLHDRGIYRCICCDNALFSSDTKFESGTGWPSFWQPIARENVIESTDDSLGQRRTAVSCRLCDAHLGHVFDDGPRPTGQRYCMNSAAMNFVKIA
jgi:peptide-methionine (R)-S-oxide reductase